MDVAPDAVGVFLISDWCVKFLLQCLDHCTEVVVIVGPSLSSFVLFFDAVKPALGIGYFLIEPFVDMFHYACVD